MGRKIILIDFFILTLVFAFIAAIFTVPGLGRVATSPIFLLFSGASLLCLGLILVYLTIKEGIKGKTGKFLLLTGFSSIGIFSSVILHNFIYALIFAGLLKIPQTDESFFFILATLVFPTSFFVGIIGTIILLVKNRLE